MNVSRMSHRKWRESKQQLTSWPDLALPGCCLVCLHILCNILLTFTVKHRLLMREKGDRMTSHAITFIDPYDNIH